MTLGRISPRGAEWGGEGSCKIECHLAFAGHSILYRISPNAASIPKCGSLAQTAQEVPSSWAVVLSASRSDAIELILALPITVAVQADEQNSKKIDLCPNKNPTI